MQDDPEVVIEDEHEVGNGLLIVGMPTLGVVGTITAQYLIDHLDMPEVGGVYSPRFPPIGRIQQGKSGFPVRLHAIETRCGLDLTCQHLIVAVTEFLPGPSTVYELADALTRWAKETDAAGIVVPDGLLVQGEESGDVRGVAATDAGLATLHEAGVERLDDGVIAGFTAALVANGRRRGVDVLALLSESAYDRPDSRSAARLLKLLDRFVPDVPIETKPLLEEAKRIEEQAQRVREKIEQRSEHPDGGFDQMVL